MRVIIADLVTELYPKYEKSVRLAEPFLYEGDRETDIRLKVTEKHLENLMKRAAKGIGVEEMENFAFSCDFNIKAIRHRTMLVHSSALIHNNEAYLFSADSGIGKSTHTRLWLKAFGDKVHIMNDDKPVVRFYGDKAVACGTPFDGGSSIALNEKYPLKAIVFLERGEQNQVRIPGNKEIIQKLYFQTAHMVNAETAELMLENIEKLLSLSKFYVLTCNTDISAAYTAYEQIVAQS
ncbi:MAG: hypothetical protein IIZ36_00795 [Ruminococcus sp.]|nr:hypothetical protein [Ruminococcus sp.]